jgi:hypothetical protein
MAVSPVSPVVESLRVTVFSDGRMVIKSPNFGCGETVQCLAIAIRKCSLAQVGTGEWQLTTEGSEPDPEGNRLPRMVVPISSHPRYRRTHPSERS